LSLRVADARFAKKSVVIALSRALKRELKLASWRTATLRKLHLAMEDRWNKYPFVSPTGEMNQSALSPSLEWVKDEAHDVLGLLTASDASAKLIQAMVDQISTSPWTIARISETDYRGLVSTVGSS